MPVLFVGIGEVPKNPVPSAGHYANPRVKDPCPEVGWPKLSNPKKLQKMAVLTCLAEIVNPKAIYFLSSMVLVELALNDGHSYEPHSLPGIVAGRTTLYHYSETPFLISMKDLHRERRLDRAKWEFPEIGPLPQDCTDCLIEPLCLPLVSASPQVAELRVLDMKINHKPPQQESVCGIQGPAKPVKAW